MHFGWIRQQCGRVQSRQPAPQCARPFAAKDMVPDATDWLHVRLQFLLHFPHGRLDLRFSRLNPSARKTYTQRGAHHPGTTANE